LPGSALTAAYTIFAGLEFVTGTFGFIAGNLLWSAFASAATPVLGAWSGELYPTRARATAESTASVAGAIGGIAGLQAVSVLSQTIGLGRALALAAVIGLAGAGLLLLLPETKQAPLPD
jgi:MFS family permease